MSLWNWGRITIIYYVKPNTATTKNGSDRKHCTSLEELNLIKIRSLIYSDKFDVTTLCIELWNHKECSRCTEIFWTCELSSKISIQNLLYALRSTSFILVNERMDWNWCHGRAFYLHSEVIQLTSRKCRRRKTEKHVSISEQQKTYLYLN